MHGKAPCCACDEDRSFGFPERTNQLFCRHCVLLHTYSRVQDTVTGFLLAGIGQRDASGANFLVVDASKSRLFVHCHFHPIFPTLRPTHSTIHLFLHTIMLLLFASAPIFAETPRETIERTFTSFTTNPEVGLIIINQPIADAIRPLVAAHKAIIPMVLEIPSKDVTYNPAKDAIMKRVLQMLGEAV